MLLLKFLEIGEVISEKSLPEPDETEPDDRPSQQYVVLAEGKKVKQVNR